MCGWVSPDCGGRSNSGLSFPVSRVVCDLKSDFLLLRRVCRGFASAMSNETKNCFLIRSPPFIPILKTAELGIITKMFCICKDTHSKLLFMPNPNKSTHSYFRLLCSFLLFLGLLLRAFSFLLSFPLG